MIFTAQDLALTAGFKTSAKFTNEMHRYGLPFGTGVRVGNAKRYAGRTYRYADAMRRLTPDLAAMRSSDGSNP